MTKRTTTTVCMLMSIAATPCVAAGSTEQAPPREEMLQRLLDARAGITSIELSFFAVGDPPPPAGIIHERVHFAAQSDRIRTDLQRRIETEPGLELDLERLSSYDGEVYQSYTSTSRQSVSSFDFVDDDFDMSRSTLFNFMRFYPSRSVLHGVLHPSDLVELLSSSTTFVRPDIEMLDQHPCVVIDIHPEIAPDVRTETLWLDLERGLLPLRQTGYLSDGGVFVERTIDDAIQVGPDVWFPIAATHVFPAGVTPLAPEGARYIFVVDSDAEGPIARINHHIPDSHFRAEQDFPEPRLHLDERVGELTMLTNATTTEAHADAVLASLPDRENVAPRHASRWPLAAWIAAGALGFAGAYFTGRRR